MCEVCRLGAASGMSRTEIARTLMPKLENVTVNTAFADVDQMFVTANDDAILLTIGNTDGTYTVYDWNVVDGRLVLDEDSGSLKDKGVEDGS